MKSRQPSRFSPKRQARPTRKLKLEVFACLEDRTVPTVDLGTAGMIKDEILVQFSMDTNVQQRALDRYNLNVQLKDEILGAQRLNMGDGAMELIKLPAGISSEKALAWYKSQPGVVFAEPNYHVTATAVSNDPYYTSGQLWGMEGSDSPTAVGPAGTTNTYGINAEAAWNDGQTGSKSIFVGIVDTGIQITHPDIADNIWTNPYDPVDGIDNDGNGFVDDIHGWDFSNNDNTVFDSATYDDHGTHVAGTIGGKGGNGAGVAGVNWNVTMISAKFLGPTGGTTADAVRAIDYITDLKVRHSMDVVATNNSWGGGGYSAALHSAIIRAAKADILTVIAAGNSTTNNDVTASYPSNTSTLVATTTDTAASYEGVIAVASLDSTGALSYFSSYGKTTVDIAAPGAGIWSSIPTSTYASFSGTSMATPHVTGSVALLASKYPTATALQLRTAILATATPTASVTGKVVTDGRLNVQAALNYSGFGTPPVIPSMSIANVSMAEGNAGTSVMAFTVTLSQAATTPVTVNYATSNGTALAGSDYVATSGTLTIAAGATTGTINVTINGDTTVEADETLIVTLSGASANSTIGTATATGTITNDDVAPPVIPSISIANATLVEGNAGTSVMAFTVTLSQAATTPVTVNYATSNGTALAGSDYVATSGTLTIAAGATTGTINVTINGDTTVEADETLIVTLSGASANSTIGTATATGTITNDDVAPPPTGLPSISIASVSKAEGNVGTSNIVFTVTLSQPSATPVTVNFATSDLTALAGSDYISKSGSVTIPAGSTTGTFFVSIYGDTTLENDDIFKVTLSGASANSVIGTGVASGTIANDDASPVSSLPILSLGNAIIAEGNSGTSNMVFTVSMNKTSTTAVKVDYYSSAMTATAGEDYTPVYTTLTIPAGAMSATFNVVVSGDTKFETDENFGMYLLNAKNASIAIDRSVGVILNDDLPTVSINNVTQLEGDTGTKSYIFTVQLSDPLTTDVSVNYLTSDFTAIAGQDYQAQTGTLVIPAGSTTGTITITGYGDTTIESDEQFKVLLTNLSSNAALLNATGIGTILTDDVQQTVITATNSSVLEGNRGSTRMNFTLTRSGNLAVTSQIFLYTDDTTGTATEFVDYQGAAGYVTFLPGETTKIVQIKVYGDTTVEADETFKLRMAYPTNAVLALDYVTGTILNDDNTVLGASVPSTGNSLQNDLQPASTQSADPASQTIISKKRTRLMV